jgi:hypothetical protein
MSSIPDSNPATPQSSSTPVNPPVTPPGAAHATFPPAQVLSPTALTSSLRRAGTVPRILLLAAGILVCLCFFTPQFFVSMSLRDAQIPAEMRSQYYHSWLLFGWSTWWGVISFILTFLTVVALIADILLAEIKGLRFMLRFGYTLVFALLTLTTGLGLLLGLFGVGLGVGRHYGADLGPALSDYSLLRVPIMSLPMFLMTVVALVISGWLLVREMRLAPGSAPPATQPPGAQVAGGDI